MDLQSPGHSSPDLRVGDESGVIFFCTRLVASLNQNATSGINT